MEKIIKSWYQKKPDICFEDLYGMNDVAEKLKYSVIWMNNDSVLHILDTVCNGILLYGCPGTGKTAVVHALANYMMSRNENVSFLSISASQIKSNFVGEEEKNIHAAFNEAIKCSAKGPCILFFEEIDDMVKERRNSNTSALESSLTTEFLISYNQLVKSKAQVIVLGTTNYPWLVDNSVICRFNSVLIPLPSEPTRKGIFEQRLQNVQLADNLTIEDMAKDTNGFNLKGIKRLLDDMLKNFLDSAYAQKKQDSSEFEDLSAEEQDYVIVEGIKSGEFKLTRENYDAVRSNYSDFYEEQQQMSNYMNGYC